MTIYQSDLHNDAKNLSSALLSLSKTQRRLAHRAKREALEAEQNGQLSRYRQMRREAERLWCEAKWHLDWARRAKTIKRNKEIHHGA